MPESRYEVIDGEVVYMSPADPPHASRHSKLSALLEAYVGPGFEAASDMLTRTSDKGDMAPDASVYPSAPDPGTGGRQIEHLAFEVVSTESLAAAAKKADALATRGVRRVFAIDVERRRGLEWSRKTATWEILPADGTIDDRSLVLPLQVHDLVAAAKADDAVARALLVKKNPVLVEALTAARTEGKAEGKVEGKAEAILAVLASRAIRVDRATAKAIRATHDLDALDEWLARAATCNVLGELFAPPASRPKARSKKSRRR